MGRGFVFTKEGTFNVVEFGFILRLGGTGNPLFKEGGASPLRLKERKMEGRRVFWKVALSFGWEEL